MPIAEITDELIGKRVKTLAEFYLLPAGSEGKITKIYKIGERKGIKIIWDKLGLEDGFSEEELKYLEFI